MNNPSTESRLLSDCSEVTSGLNQNGRKFTTENQNMDIANWETAARDQG